MADDQLAKRFGRYLEAHLPGAAEVTVQGLERIHGGASRETFRCSVISLENGRRIERALILRRDPPSSLIETERELEFAAYATFQDSAVPVPKVLFLEPDCRWLERPFFVMELVPGVAANPFAPDPYGASTERIGEQFWRTLGRIAAKDPRGTPVVTRVRPVQPEECSQRELEHWEGVIDEDELEPQPIARAAIRWLRRNPPPPPSRLAIVHGDYRSGNFLFDDRGEIRAILDWEMCHIGDPLEDVGWACDPLWGGMSPERPGQMIPKDRGLEIWQAESGRAIDPQALRWWEIFSHVKGLAIWISSAKEYAAGSNHDPVLLLSSWLCTTRHNRILSERLRRLRCES